MIRRLQEQTIERREQMRGGQGITTVQTLFTPAEFGANIRLCARLTLPPGASIGPHAHNDEDEVYVIIRGEGIVTDSPEPGRAVGPGDAVLTGQGASHSIANSGDTPLELIAMIARYPATA